ncbi:MAG TPA: division plane positioning ATPase MipZ [Gaiellaceae bacterium]|jgi:Mrp family chromosome partitioning ATPase/capsular polysaccharide biosynthesis protein
MEGDSRNSPTLVSYLRVVKRRWWLAALCAVLVPTAAFFFSQRQPAQYESSAEVYFNNQNIAAAVSGIQDSGFWIDNDRALETQANLAQTPEVARRALGAAGISDLSPADVLAETSVEQKGNSDILTFWVTDPDPERARVLADAMAQSFVAGRAELDTDVIKQARADVVARLDELRAERKRKSPAYEALELSEQQLATFETLRTKRASVIRKAETGYQVAPTTKRSTALGVILGLVLGIGLALALDAMDTRIRSGSEVAGRLRLPLLARLPTPPRRLAKRDELVMLAQPTGTHAEAFRMLRTNLAFTELDARARTLLITSAVEKEGKTTTAANLALALARAGRRVALVDLDLRQPYLERFFDLPTTPGVTDVALGNTPLEEALQPIDLGTGRRSSRRNGTGANGRAELGTLDVLVSGPIPPDPGEFVGTRKLADILESLHDDYDAVILDSPPLLRVGDALTLSNRADGIIVVVRLRVARRAMLDEVRRLLLTSPTPALGFVVTGADAGKKDDPYGYGNGYGRVHLLHATETAPPLSGSRMTAGETA